MKKEALTLDHIKRDLTEAAMAHRANMEDWHIGKAIGFVALALLLDFLLWPLPFWLVGAVPAAYQVYQYVREHIAYRRRKEAIGAAIARGDFSITKETLTATVIEEIYEPHMGYRRAHSIKGVPFFYFESGSRWRAVDFMHYDWSRELHLSTQGLMNVSLAGDEFYFISLQGNPDIAYIYPCKFFVLDQPPEKEQEKTE